MRKRVLFALGATAACLTLFACGGKKDEDALMEEETNKTASAAPAGAPAAAPAAAPAGAPATGGATVTGKVNFDGAAPAMPQIKMDADAYCKAEHK
ncbi:MAG TPA: hypothetical protein VMH79_01155, partial [Thermoanaerobaculia bacterium]|nr:hypothetical protein [Thermoanaerobaculia bacterium]